MISAANLIGKFLKISDYDIIQLFILKTEMRILSDTFFLLVISCITFFNLFLLIIPNQ